MSDAETSADFASELNSHLDSSGGDYSDLLDQLEKCDEDAVSDIVESVTQADEQLTEAFELLDGVVLDAIEYDGTHGRFTKDVGAEVREIADLFESAENCIESALEASQSIEDSDVPEDFQFGVHTDPESALQYLHGDVRNMREIAFEMRREY